MHDNAWSKDLTVDVEGHGVVSHTGSAVLRLPTAAAVPHPLRQGHWPAPPSLGQLVGPGRRIATANTEITSAVQASGNTLTKLRGIGDLTAGKILARVGDVHRFRSAAAFAS